MKLCNTIICAKCKKPVDNVKVIRDWKASATIFTVHCHGQEQVVRLGDIDLKRAYQVEVAEAFAGV